MSIHKQTHAHIWKKNSFNNKLIRWKCGKSVIHHLRFIKLHPKSIVAISRKKSSPTKSKLYNDALLLCSLHELVTPLSLLWCEPKLPPFQRHRLFVLYDCLWITNHKQMNWASIDWTIWKTKCNQQLKNFFFKKQAILISTYGFPFRGSWFPLMSPSHRLLLRSTLLQLVLLLLLRALRQSSLLLLLFRVHVLCALPCGWDAR